MKKKLLSALLAVSMVMTLCACGSKEKDAATTENADTAQAVQTGAVSTKDYNPDDYVTLGDYSGVEVTVDVVNFTDEDVEKQFNDEVEYYLDYMDLYTYTVSDKTTVEEGDIANIDYVGKKDGVAFDGGTAQGHNLEIGSGSFIDGFEEGLVGLQVGEKTTLNLTFPEEYHSEELAGEAVTFDVTINSINTKEMPEITDELIAQFGVGFDSIAAFKEDIKSYLQETCDETNAEERNLAVWQAVYQLCTVNDPPQEMIDDVLNTIKQNAESYAAMYGVTADEFITNYMGYASVEDYEADCKLSAVEACKEKLVVAAIAKKAGIVLSDEDVKAAAEAEYDSYGYESADALLADIGAGAYYDYILTDRVYEYLATCVTIKENEPVSILADEEEEVVLEVEEISEEDVSVVEVDEFEEEYIDDEEFIEEDTTGEMILQTE